MEITSIFYPFVILIVVLITLQRIGVSFRTKELEIIAKSLGYTFTKKPSKKQISALPGSRNTLFKFKNLMSQTLPNGILIRIYDSVEKRTQGGESDFSYSSCAFISSVNMNVGSFSMNSKLHSRMLSSISNLMGQGEIAPISTGIIELDRKWEITGSPELKIFENQELLNLLNECTNISLRGDRSTLTLENTNGVIFLEGKMPSAMEELAILALRFAECLPLKEDWKVPVVSDN